MIKAILTPEDTHIEFDIPLEYVGKKIEITFSPVEDVTKPKVKKTMADFLGILSKESGEKLQTEIKKSRDEWERDI